MDLTDLDSDKVKKEEAPDWVEPTLAKLTDKYFSDPDWIYERKLDGVRCLVFKKDDDVQLLSRNKKNKNKVFPELVEALKKQDKDFIADGEIVTYTDSVTSFAELQPRINKENPSEELIEKVPTSIYLFDIMHLEGVDLTEIDLKSRKKILRDQLNFENPIRYCIHVNGEGENFLDTACEKGWEGIIAKDGKQPYINGRTSKWLKFKCDNRQEFVVGGFTDPEGERVGFGSLLVGFYENTELKYAGRVGTGYSDEQLEEMREQMDELEQENSPFDQDVDDEDVHYIKPELVAEVGFTEWTENNKLRHPRFIGLRDDKDPKEVEKEAPA